jgi:two-component system OmpR family sensor kinase
VSAPVRAQSAKDVTLEAAQAVGEALPRTAELPERAELQGRRVRDWLGAAGSARTRILIAYTVLLALAATLGILGFRQALLIRLEDDVDDEMRQEVNELDRLLEDGRDPDTGKPFANLRELFDTYFARNVPSRDEALIGFVEGQRYDSSTLSRFPLDRIPSEALVYGAALGSRSPGDETRATGRIDTELGEAFYRATRIEFEDDVGAFLVLILPANEREEIGDLLTYGGAAALGVLLIASACAWLIAGRVLAPVRLLTETAQSISQSDLTQRIEVRGSGEAADMARSFNAMLDRLEAVFRSQREFVQDANHELRDPLTIVRGHLELLDEDPADRERAIKLMLDELDRIARIVDDLQLLAEVDQPGFLRMEWNDLELLSSDLVSKARALAPRNWLLEESAGGLILADRHRVTEAVMNLAHNAVQHTTPDDAVAIGTSIDEDGVRIWVRDTGTGITVADQGRIFDRFTRGTDAHVRYRGGGLGLAIVKAVAEAHGGRVELESRLGEGSKFTILIPRHSTNGTPGGADSDR